MIAFTICARNYLAHASVLHGSIVQHCPGAVFLLALADSTNDINYDTLPFQVITLEELGIPHLPRMLERYDVTEISTAVKPFVFSFLFDRFPRAPIVYFDP